MNKKSFSSGSTQFNPPPHSYSTLANAHSLLPTANTSIRPPSVDNDPKIHPYWADVSLPPGPAHYHARRLLWTSRPSPTTPPVQQPESRRRDQNPNVARVESLLNENDFLNDPDVWSKGLKSLSRGLLGGSRLRHSLPLSLVIKILHATWVRDGTYPQHLLPSPSPPPVATVPEDQEQDDDIDMESAETTAVLDSQNDSVR